MRGKPNVQLVAMYLITAPGANMIGLFYLPVVLIAHEVGISDTEARSALATLGRMDVAHYDSHQEIVWVPQMARHQIEDELRGGDKRKAGVQRELEPFLRHPFAADFVSRYGDAFDVPAWMRERALEGPSKDLHSLAETLPSQDQDQDQDQEQEQDQYQSSPRPPERSAGTPIGEFGFPCDGKQKTWHLTQQQLVEWEGLYPNVNVLGECRKAMAWIRAKPERQKTAKGMAPFLVNWLGRATDRPGARAGPANGIERKEDQHRQMFDEGRQWAQGETK